MMVVVYQLQAMMNVAMQSGPSLDGGRREESVVSEAVSVDASWSLAGHGRIYICRCYYINLYGVWEDRQRQNSHSFDSIVEGVWRVSAATPPLCSALLSLSVRISFP